MFSRRSLRRALIALALSAGLALAAVSAFADRPSSDRTTVTQILAQLQTPAGSASSIAARPLAEAKAALARADSAAASGDTGHARLLEGLAREWAELALDTTRAVQVQQDAGALQQAAADASLRVDRARAMLDELSVRKARAQGELEVLRQQADSGAAPVSKPVKPTPPSAPAKAGPAKPVPPKPVAPANKGAKR